MRWRLLASFGFAVAPAVVPIDLIEFWHVSIHSAAIAMAASYLPCVLLCMVLAQNDGIQMERDRNPVRKEGEL